MTAFEVARILTSQGIDKIDMARVLESLHKERLLPTWGPGETGAHLSTREVALTILGATAPQPKCAAAHVAHVATLAREDGLTLERALTVMLAQDPASIEIDTLAVSCTMASIKFKNESFNLFHCCETPPAVSNVVVINGSILAAIAMKLHFSIESGWAPKPK